MLLRGRGADRGRWTAAPSRLALDFLHSLATSRFPHSKHILPLAPHIVAATFGGLRGLFRRGFVPFVVPSSSPFAAAFVPKMSSVSRVLDVLNGALGEGRLPDFLARFVPAGLMGKVRDRSPHFFQGLFLALLAMKDAFPDLSAFSKGLPGIAGALNGFVVGHSISTIVVLGIGLLILFTILAPVTFALLFLSPGLLGQVIITLAKIATYVAGEINPHGSAKLFLDALSKADPSFGNALRQRYDRAAGRHTNLGSLTSRIFGKLFKVGSFVRKDWKSWAIGFVPIVGPVLGFLGSSFSSSSDLMKEVILQPVADAEGWSEERKIQFFHSHKWTLLGYSFPFAFLINIPIVGSWALSAALGGAGSRLIPRFTTPEHRRRMSGSGGGLAEGKIVGSEGESEKSTGVKASSSSAKPSAPKLSPQAKAAASPRGGGSSSAAAGGLLSPRRNVVSAT